MLSRRHCVIETGPAGCAVRDLNSSNGTFVNASAVTMHRLEQGDQIRAGRD